MLNESIVEDAALLAVGLRVRSHRGTHFRQWASGRLNEYLVKGFKMDDEQLENAPGKGQKDCHLSLSGLRVQRQLFFPFHRHL